MRFHKGNKKSLKLSGPQLYRSCSIVVLSAYIVYVLLVLRQLAVSVSKAGDIPEVHGSPVITGETMNLSTKKRKEKIFLFNSTSTGVDVVYTWVNGSEPIHKKQLERYKAGAYSPKAIELNRFRTEWNELFYSLRLLYKHASHLKHVYVVTSGERPWYANQFPQVTWVNHSEFIPQEFLPTFSSRAIEFGLVHLLGRLSDPFLYMNDDFLILKPLDLKEHTRHKIWYQDAYGKEWTDFSNTGDTYSQAIASSQMALKRHFPQQYRPANCLGHVPVTVRHSTMHRIHTNMPHEIHATMAQFRNPGSMALNYMLSQVERYTDQNATEKVQFLPSNKVTTFIPIDDNSNRLNKILISLLKHPTQFCCMNDDVENPSPEHFTIISGFFEQVLH